MFMVTTSADGVVIYRELIAQQLRQREGQQTRDFHVLFEAGEPWP